MVRPANLKRKLALLAVLVVAGHVVGLEWITREIGQISGLKLMTPPMYTRTIAPAAPAPVVAAAPAPEPAPPPSAYAAAAPRLPASAAEALRRKRAAQEAARREARERERQEAEARAEADQQAMAEALARAQAEERARQEQLARAAEPAASAASAASAPVAAASAAAEAAGLDQWPVDTRLSYVLTGMYRGPLYGDARVQWLRQGGKYEVRLDCKVQVFGTQVLTSQGDVTPGGLVPRAYEELGPRKRRMARLGDQVVTLDNGRTVPRPPGVQDSASQFVELTQRFATGREVLEVGRSIKVWLARPGGVDQWEYDIVGREPRSEERRVGKECRSRWSPYH